MIVTLNETYDLSTTQWKMGLIAIRTPTMAALDKKWPGFVRNFKFVRPLKCDVKVACASSLPADPLQIGTSAGKVAPQDLFNPILYKTVTNDSWNGVLNRIYGSQGFIDSLSGAVHMAGDAFGQVDPSVSFNTYYALLSEPGWKKAHPQAGLSMANVVPLVFDVLNTIGAPTSSLMQNAPTGAVIAATAAGNTAQTTTNGNYYLKGRPSPLPRVPTAISAGDVMDSVTGEYTGISVNLGEIPRCYCAVLCLPPSELQLLYYRLVVSWTVEFSVPRSDAELGLLQTTNLIGTWSHYPAAQPASKIADVSESATSADNDHAVEADGVDLNLVMDV